MKFKAIIKDIKIKNTDTDSSLKMLVEINNTKNNIDLNYLNSLNLKLVDIYLDEAKT